MSENTSKNTALIAANLNCAFFLQGQNALMVSGTDGSVMERFDNYIYSQLRALNPEIKEETFESIEDLRPKIKKEYIKSEVLSVALELMDSKLSEKYRRQAAIHLQDEIELAPDLLQFIGNRFYSTILPKEFNPTLALGVLGPSSPSSLRELYDALPDKSRLFSQFYTLFKIYMNKDYDKQLALDYDLTELGIYAQFTRALANRDLVVYNIAVSSTIEYFSNNNIDFNSDVFDKIRLELNENYSVDLKLQQIEEASHSASTYSTSETKTHLRVFVLEDDKIFASKIIHALQANLNVEIIHIPTPAAKFSRLVDFATIIKDSAADLLLLDVDSTDIKGYELLRMLASGYANSNKLIFYFPTYALDSPFIYSLPINTLNYFPRRSPFETFVENISKNFPFALKVV